jgi:hypothetical protein
MKTGSGRFDRRRATPVGRRNMHGIPVIPTNRRAFASGQYISTSTQLVGLRELRHLLGAPIR